MDQFADIRNMMVAQVLSGIVANEKICHNREDFDDFIDEYVKMANVGVDKILNAKYHNVAKSEVPIRTKTGICDATGKEILDGDIIVYTRWWACKDIEKRDEILKDLIQNFKKYKDRISLHPVWFDEDMHIFCTDTHSDADPLYKIQTGYVYIVSNNIEHPELYNH